MLTLILGRGKSGKTSMLLEAVRACPAQGMAQRIVIVPEQLSHQTERRLGAICGDSVSFVSEVLSFTRLQNRVSSMYGGSARKSLDKGGRILTAKLALATIGSQLKVFASAAGRADFLGSVLATVDELKSYEIGEKRLLEASRETEGLLAQKLRELGIILGAYNALMAQGTCDPRDKLELLRAQLLETDYAWERYFFVDGFTDYSAQEMGILEALLRRGKHLTVTVPCDPEEEGAEPFGPGRETATRLMGLGRAVGTAVEVIPAGYGRRLPEALTYLEKNLFIYAAPAFSGPTRGITLVAAQDALEECRRCVAALKGYAMEGLRWRDMLVAVGEPERYAPLMEALCREGGVPLYTGMKTPITAHPAAAFLLCALEAAVEGMDTDTVIAYLRTGYSGIGPDDCDALENYAYTWAIRGSRWQRTWTEHPEGYDGRFTPETQAELARLNALRETALGPLLRLMTGLRSAGNVRAQVLAVYGFLEETGLYQKITEELSRLTRQGKQEEAQETAQVFNTLVDCLQQLSDVLGETAQSSGELLKLLRLALEQYELGTIPAVLDAVQLGALETVRGMEPKILFVLGANEGVLPAVPSGGSLLTERERGILENDLNITLAPDSEGAMARELLRLYGALTAPTQGLWVSYALSAGGESLSPSFVPGRLQALFPDLTLQTGASPAETALTSKALAQVYFAAEEQGQRDLQQVIRAAAAQLPELEQEMVSAKAATVPRELLIPTELSGRLFGTPVILTASRLDQYGSCPLSFFLRYGIKARPRKEATFDAAEFGTFLHYILEKTLGELSRRPQITALAPEESQTLVERYMEPYLTERLGQVDCLSPRQRYLYRRNSQEAEILLRELSQELAQSDFRPCALELKFGGSSPLPALEITGSRGKGRLDGTIDRVDLWQTQGRDYIRVIDYKSGTKKFDYTDLYGGVGMQLLVYLFSLEHSGLPGIAAHPLPAGALYFPAKRSFVSVEQPTDQDTVDELRRKSGIRQTGVVLGEEPVLYAMEHDPKYLPIRRRGDLGDYALSGEALHTLDDFIQRQMAQVVDNICAGHFAPAPFYRGQSHDPCQWCDYGDVCQKDRKFRQSHYHPTLKAADFWNLIGGEEHG